MPEAAPTPVAVSERRAAEAFEAYTKKEYAVAVALYLEAYEAAPSGSILFNVARIYDLKLSDRPLAISYYRRYIADPGAYTERIELANQRLTELRNAELSASKVKEPELPREGSPGAPSGNRTSPGTLREASGDSRGGFSTLRWTGVAVGAAGLLGVGIGAGFGLAAMSKASTAGETCDGNACSTQSGVDAADAAAGHAKISTIGFTAGGALLITGGALYLLGGERRREQSSRASLDWDAEATASGASLRLSGRW